jgi:hypothetical protein
MNQRYILRTRDGEQYHLIQAGLNGPWTLIFSPGPYGQRKFHSLNQALHTLGGMVQWDDWSRSSRSTLLGLNHEKAI